MPSRDYTPLLQRAVAGPRDACMRAAVDVLWDAFGTQGVSWIGFYLHDPGAPEGQELVLGPRRDKPACSPIGLHGCCGRCFLDKRPLLVHDVAALGASYIACDPRDKSELVLPLLSDDGTCWGVLDADSYETNAFDQHDLAGMTAVLEHLGLTSTGG